MADEVVEEYRSSLDDLTFNSKPLISMLTMLADDHVQYAAEIVQVIEAHIQKAEKTQKLPALYLLDSIIKNIADSGYPRLFSQNLVSMFCGVFEKVDEKTRQAMWKLRQTWADIIPNKRLYALDIRIQCIDPAWPITSQPPEEPANIHVNPKFLIKQEQAEKAKKEQEEQEALMRQQLLAKQQELLKLQQERLELELAEAKARLVSQAKQIESQPPQLPGQPAPAVPKAIVIPKVEPSDRSNSGSPVNIPTIAVQGIVRDPRSGARDPRRGGSASHSPTKELTSAAATPRAKKTTVSASKVLRSTPTGSPAPPDVAATPSESASKPRASSSARSSASSSGPRGASRGDKDEHAKSSRDKSSHGKSASSSGSSRKKLSPLKARQGERRESEEGRKAGGSADRYGGARGSKHSPSASSASSGSSGRSSNHRATHRQSSRSLTPDKDKKINTARSRSRSPRRSPRGASLERKDAGGRPRGELPLPSRDVDKRQRSPDTEVVVVEHDEPSETQPMESGDDLAEPPAKKSKPEEELSADFRELFGNEDQDYRQLPSTSFPTVPSTPPTPGTPGSGRWAQFKAERPQEFPFQQPRLTVDMPAPGQLQDVDMRSPPLRRMSAQSPSMPHPQMMTISPDQMNINIPAPLMLEQLDNVLMEADEQLRTGRLSHEQHQAMLKQLGELQKLQQLRLQLQGQPQGADGSQSLLTRDNPFQLGPERPDGDRRERGDARYDDARPLDGFNREGKDVDQRTLPPHRREGLPPMAPPPRPPAMLDFHPDEDLRKKPLQPPPMPMMRPPVPPPFLAGPGGPRPRGPRPVFDRRIVHPLGHLSSGRYSLPYDTNLFYVPEHDPRWITQNSDGHQHKLFIDDRAFELPLGCPPRHIVLGETRVQISVDTVSRGIKIDGICYYKIGDLPRKVTINGSTYLIFYRGPEKKVWIDELAFEVHADGPPEPVIVNDKEHIINIDSIHNQVLVDNRVVCPFGGPQQQIDIGYQKHDIQFEPPQRKILIDGKLYEMNFTGKFPCVKTDGVDYGIRFDGTAREIMINGKPWTVEMEVPRKARIAAGRVHVIGFGGPGHEVIINGQWYEVKFSGIEKSIRLGNQLVKIRLEGPPPEVKILGQVVRDPMKIQELVGDNYIDPAVAVMTKREFEEPREPREPRDERNQQQFDQGPRLRMAGPDVGPRHMGPSGIVPQRLPEMGRGMPPHRGAPRGGFHEGPPGPPPRGVPQHMEERGRGSPQFDEPGGRNSPNHPDNFNNMHNMDMDMDRPPQPLPHRLDGPRPLYAPHGPPQQPFGRPPGRGFRGGRNRGGRGARGGMGRRDDFYPHGHPQGGNMRGMGQHRMQRPPNVPHPPQDNFNNNFFTPPPQLQQQDQAYGAMPGMSQPPPAFGSQIDINDLFGKLINSGIIKKADDAPPAPPTSTASTAPATALDVKSEQAPGNAEQVKTENGEQPVAEKPALPKPKPKEKLPEVPDMTDFNLDRMKKRHHTVLQRMYGGIQCSSCGVRFITDDMDKYREHLDWHFRQNRRDKDGVKVAKFRQWYYTTNEWIQFEEIGDLEERTHSMYFERLLQTQPLPGSTGAMQMPAAPISCPAATGNAREDVCEMCGEQFENFFDEETEEWCLRDAIRVGQKTYHPACYEDDNESMHETPEATEEAADPVKNPLAFLSLLTAVNPSPSAATTTDTTAVTTTDTTAAASDVKPEVDTTTAVTIKTEVTPEVAPPPASTPQEVKPLVIAPLIKTEATPMEVADNETTNKITTVGATSS